MFRKYLLIMLLATGLFTLQGCSLFSSDSEEGEDAVAEEGMDSDEEVVDAETSDESDSEVASGSEDTEVSDTEELADNSDEEEVVDEYPDDDYGDESSTATASSDLPDQPMESDSNSSSEESLYVQGDDSSSSETAAAESSVSQDTISDSSSMGFVPVRKMKRTPYTANGVLINRLYVARNGDDMSSVAEKIYGDSSRKKDLLSWNSHFQGKSLKVGDKVYYNSARNPADGSQIMLYYEEAGIQPQIYTAKSGDSIRKVSQSLLGHPNSWMEIWATNEVESKWQMPEGTSLKYWPDGTSAPPPVPVQQAALEQPPAAPPAESAPMNDDMDTNSAQTAAASPEEIAPPSEDLPPLENTEDVGAAAQVAQNEEPPPPPSDMAPPPPPPPAAAETAAPTEAAAGGESGGIADLMSGQDDTTMIAVLGGLLLVAAFILLIFLKRGRKKVNFS